METRDPAGRSPAPARPPRRVLVPRRAGELPQRADAWVEVRHLALRQLDRLVALEPKVLRDESPRPAHDLRVASRRLQSLLDLLCPAPRPPELRKLRRRLVRARRALGELRNFDVMLARIDRALARKRTARRAAWEAAGDHVRNLRGKQAERSFRKLAKLNLADLYVRLRPHLMPAGGAIPSGVIAFPEAQTGDQPPDFAARLGGRLRELWQDLTACAAERGQDPARLHALRIAAKRLRYLMEVAVQLRAPGSAEAVHWLRGLQRRLGDWHDEEVLCGTLIRMVARRKFLEAHLELAIEMEKLVMSVRAAKRRSCERYLAEALESAQHRRTAAWADRWAASPVLMGTQPG